MLISIDSGGRSEDHHDEIVFSRDSDSAVEEERGEVRAIDIDVVGLIFIVRRGRIVLNLYLYFVGSHSGWEEYAFSGRSLLSCDRELVVCVCWKILEGGDVVSNIISRANSCLVDVYLTAVFVFSRRVEDGTHGSRLAGIIETGERISDRPLPGIYSHISSTIPITEYSCKIQQEF